jgi:membrane protein
VATVLGIGLAYRYGPSITGPRPALLSWGLLVAVLLWLAASEGFSIYLTNFGTYNKVYGSIGAIAAMLMWFYLSAWAILMGAAVNAALSESRQ